MESTKTPQQRMEDSFDNYFALSEILTGDLQRLLKMNGGAAHFRRNFIRSSAALFEGYAHCLREMCVLSFECTGAPRLNPKEIKVLRCADSFDAADRIRLTLRAAYTLFELVPAPTFDGTEWVNVQHFLMKRNSLMHPRTLSDLVIHDEHWNNLRNGVSWLMEQFVGFFALSMKKYVSD